MLRSIQKSPAQVARDRGFHRLHEDVLRLIMKEVTTIRALVNLTLVSRHFYALATARLYRGIELNLTCASHRRLLRQLGKPGSHLPILVRTLVVQRIDTADAESLLRLLMVIPAMSNLRYFNCQTSFTLPECLLQTLHSSLSRSGVDVEKALNLTRLPQPLHTVFFQSANLRLEFLTIKITKQNEVWPNFKSDVIGMLLQTRAMKGLVFSATCRLMKPFPDMLPYFEEKDLPALQVLSLHTDDHTPLFTAAELLEWGAQGGWDKLKTLSFQNMDYLPAFLGHTPILANLGVLLRRKRDADTLQRYIEAAGLSSPLGCQLGHLQFSGPRSKTYTRPQDRCLIPWYLLNVAPNLTTLHLHRYIRVPFLPELCMDTPTAQEVHDISKLCPDLAEIRLDMELIFSRSHKPLWPSEVLTALAQFKRPIKLMIYLHAKNPGTANFLLNQAVYKKVFNRIVDERERL